MMKRSKSSKDAQDQMYLRRNAASTDQDEQMGQLEMKLVSEVQARLKYKNRKLQIKIEKETSGEKDKEVISKKISSLIALNKDLVIPGHGALGALLRAAK